MMTNSTHTYGAITKTFHWLTALLVVALIALGVVASQWPYETSAQLAVKAWFFSMHKTLGIFTFGVALLRILWALTQPKPGALNANKRVESWLAETVHWLLYGSLVLVPLTGWIHHSATTGFAPIWPPVSLLVGQSLPLIPKSEGLAHTFASLHIIFERVLLIAILLHFAGALKHHLIDKDLTLKRMLPGRTVPDILPAQHKSRAPFLTALGIWVVALGIGTALGLFSASATRAPAATLAAVPSQWQVEQGTLAITVQQLGSDVTGSFEDWTAAIDFSETPDADGIYGEVEVQIAIGSLTLGSVTGQATNADFLASETFPTATFAAPITREGEMYVADGTLTLKGSAVPVTLPFTLDITDDTATMSGETTLDRLAFKVGETYPDEASVGFDVTVSVTLTATRNAP